MTAFWDIAPCNLVEVALIMEAVRTTETSVYFNETTRRYIPGRLSPHTRHRENLKSHNS
jgi:hypothetical protein